MSERGKETTRCCHRHTFTVGFMHVVLAVAIALHRAQMTCVCGGTDVQTHTPLPISI